MATKCLPLELLFEIVPFIPAENAVPNVLSSCRLLYNFLLPRVIKWKETMKKMIKELRDEVRDRFALIEDRLTLVEGEIHAMKNQFEVRMKNLEGEVKNLEGEVKSLKGEVKSLKGEDRFTLIEDRITLIEGDIQERFAFFEGEIRAIKIPPPSPAPSSKKTSSEEGHTINQRGGQMEGGGAPTGNEEYLPLPPQMPLQSGHYSGIEPPSVVLPSRLRVEVSGRTQTSISLTWMSHSKVGMTIASYVVVVLKKSDLGLWWPIKKQKYQYPYKEGVENNATIKRLSPGTEYQLKVEAWDKHDDSTDAYTLPVVRTMS